MTKYSDHIPKTNGSACINTFTTGLLEKGSLNLQGKWTDPN